MSTALEVIAAREAGMDVLGLSLVTNLAAGIGGEELHHGEVLDVGPRVRTAHLPAARRHRGEVVMSAALVDTPDAGSPTTRTPPLGRNLSAVVAAAEGGDAEAITDLADRFKGCCSSEPQGFAARWAPGPTA